MLPADLDLPTMCRDTAAAAVRDVEAADSDEDADAEERKSKKKRKLQQRLRIADLKQTCPRPEVVEVWDVTAMDPKLLVFLKVVPPSVSHPPNPLPRLAHSVGRRAW